MKTAETHRSNIMGKLGLHSVSELVLYAVRNNIVQTAIEGDSSNSRPVEDDSSNGNRVRDQDRDTMGERSVDS